MKLRKINLKNIDGFILGNAENIDKGTGCTVIISENGAVGGVDVRGGAPATRETDLLRSENTVDSIHAVVLSGGSAFGLEAASGVMRELAGRGIGFETDYGRVPIVCAASLFDLGLGDNGVYPDIEMGKEAAGNAFEGLFEHGNRGAGTGASVGKALGMHRAMKTGLGTFACADDYIQVGAVAAVNAVGDVYNGAGNIIAGLRNEEGDEIYGTIKALKSMVHSDERYQADTETSSSAEHDRENDKPKAKAFDLRNANKHDIASAIKSAFINKSKEPSPDEELRAEPESEYSDAQDIPASVVESPSGEVKSQETEPEMKPEPEMKTETESEAETETETETETKMVTETETREEYIDPDMGYDIPFNTTISCLITNAKLSKSQANKLATILHDAYARSIKPVHSSMDGDAVFVLASGKQEVNFDAFAALACDVMQYAIIDAANSAKSAYGLPASCDMTG